MWPILCNKKIGEHINDLKKIHPEDKSTKMLKFILNLFSMYFYMSKCSKKNFIKSFLM